MRSPVDSSSFGSSAALPFPDKLSNTLGLARGQIDQDRKDGRAIQKVQGSVSAAGTPPCKVIVRGRGTYGSYASRDLGTVVGISPFCECLNLFVFFVFFKAYDPELVCVLRFFLGIRSCGVWRMHCLRALC